MNSDDSVRSEPEQTRQVETGEPAPPDEVDEAIRQAILEAAPERVVPCQDCQGWKVIFREETENTIERQY